MRSLILWLLALGLGLTGYDAYRDRDERGDGARFESGAVVVAPSALDQVHASEGTGGLPPPPGGKR